MGKNRIRESLTKQITNTVVHKIVLANTGKSESKPHLESEIIEYHGQSEKFYGKCNWNEADIDYIKTKSLKKIKEKLKVKYSDVEYKEKDVERSLDEEIEELKIL